MSIRRRIFLGIILLFSVGFYFLIDIIADDIELRYRESTEEPLVDTARVLASMAAASSSDGQVDVDLFKTGFENVLQQQFSAQIFGLLKTHVDIHVYITNQHGQVIFDSDYGWDEGEDYSLWRDVFYTLQGEYGARTTAIEGDEDRKMIYVSSPILQNNKLIGVLAVGKPTNSSSQFARAAEQKLMIGGTIACLILIALGLLLGVWVTTPIQKLTDYAKAIGQGKRISRPTLGSNEMEELGLAFEQMRDALDGKHYIENYVQTLTHEIKSPLSAIRGAVELLEENSSSKHKHTLLQNVHQESERIKNIVDNLLLLSSLESCKYIVSPKNIEIPSLLEGIQQMFAPLLLIKQITLDIQDNTTHAMQGDFNLISQALANVIQNAIDFSPTKSTIKLTVSQTLSGTKFIIRDYGSGIPEYAQDKIFDRFYSLKRPNDGRKSTGLGLSLTSEIMSLHQGKITLDNHPDGGAVSTLFFPFLKPRKIS